MGNPTAIVPPWAVESPMRAAGLPPIITVADPLTMASGGPAQTQASPTTAAGRFPIRTVATQGPDTGPPTWGMGTGKAGVCMGQTCMSVILAAGGMGLTSFSGDRRPEKGGRRRGLEVRTCHISPLSVYRAWLKSSLLIPVSGHLLIF